MVTLLRVLGAFLLLFCLFVCLFGYFLLFVVVVVVVGGDNTKEPDHMPFDVDQILVNVVGGEGG